MAYRGMEGKIFLGGGPPDDTMTNKARFLKKKLGAVIWANRPKSGPK